MEKALDVYERKSKQSMVVDNESNENNLLYRMLFVFFHTLDEPKVVVGINTHGETQREFVEARTHGK